MEVEPDDFQDINKSIGLHDSLIIKTARRMHAYLITFDKHNDFIIYAKNNNVSIINPCIFNNVNDRINIELKRSSLWNELWDRIKDEKVQVTEVGDRLYSWFVRSKERVMDTYDRCEML
ncbi:hypothetical protein [Vulcanisaeta distributa]|uniref:hypothetical protein n=1 Tax=Vulcanisaeta distributa TaxID=164451 RepID=UPI0006D10974|nr:hypothetical protein [Vulcanisaeta distributa]